MWKKLQTILSLSLSLFRLAEEQFEKKYIVLTAGNNLAIALCCGSRPLMALSAGPWPLQTVVCTVVYTVATTRFNLNAAIVSYCSRWHVRHAADCVGSVPESNFIMATKANNFSRKKQLLLPFILREQS